MPNAPERLEAALADRYRIERKLGEGGMASVYLAGDIKHERKVAVKVLKPELAAVIGAERFLSEITTTAKLQHPHILALFDSGEADGFLYYVMPYIEGETLRERLDREKQIGVDEAVKIAHDVADALDYAHRNGVIHRDIKPANILLHDGRPVVADFGIALAISAAGGGRMTETGLSLGTPHYMSPEQASADRDLSARSDVYSLGCVLYEMLAGQPPHTGPSAQSILVRILTESPRPLADLRHTVPTHVAATVMKSIEKLPADRFESAKAFAEALSDTSFTYAPAPMSRAGGAAPVAATVPAGSRHGVPVWMVAVLAAVFVAAGYALSTLETAPPTPAPSATFTVVGDSLFQLTSPCCGRSVAVSPAGDRIVFQASPAGTPGNAAFLFQRRLDQRDARVIPGTEGARHPFFSPDGQWVGFFSGAALRKVRFDGGTPLTVAGGLGTNAGAAWAPDNSIVFSTREDPVLYRVSDGGTPQAITALDTVAGEYAHYWPHVMPDGRTVLFGVGMRRGDGTSVDMIAETSLEDGGHRILTTGADPRYVERGYLVFSDAAGSLMAQAFDPRALEVSGERFRIAERSTWRGDGSSEFDISRTGTLAYLEQPTFTAGNRQLVTVDMEGKEEILTRVRFGRTPRFSPDGRYVAYEVQALTEAEQDDIWVWDQLRGIPIRVTFEGDNSLPAWSRDGSEILYDTPDGIMARAADGSGETRTVQSVPATGITAPVVSPDGAWLVWPQRGGGGWDIWGRPMAGGDPRPLLNSPFDEVEPAISPDGRWIAYASGDTGGPEIYVEPFPGLGRRFKVTTGGAYDPVWSPDGKRLYFRAEATGGTFLEAVDVVASADGFDVSEAEKLFDVASYATGHPASSFDIHPDGRHFVFVKTGDVAGGSQAAQVVITNALNPGLTRQR